MFIIYLRVHSRSCARGVRHAGKCTCKTNDTCEERFIQEFEDEEKPYNL